MTTQRELTPTGQRILAAVEYLAGWWPLDVATVCRAMAAQTKPLAKVGCRAFIDHLNTITPEHEATVRKLARALVRDGLLSRRAVDLSNHDAPF